jgi:hypothetical protein
MYDFHNIVYSRCVTTMAITDLQQIREMQTRYFNTVKINKYECVQSIRGQDRHSLSTESRRMLTSNNKLLVRRRM